VPPYPPGGFSNRHDIVTLGEVHPILVQVARIYREEQDEDVPGVANLGKWIAKKNLPVNIVSGNYSSNRKHNP
jgi:hypothetical protein